MIRLNEAQYRVVKKMAKAECANNDNGNCLLLDDGETCVCPQCISYSLLCRYFSEAVLPANREFCAEVMKDRSIDLRRCALCRTAFAAGSNRAKYCPDCAKKIRRRQKADSERNRRMRRKTTK
ncbi:TPA: cysteine-rich VLP domain-containing protein [Clostridioides difficile]|nr:cysteine-rich VLP domain-containing protein [Clostridioides difficile]HEK8908301.1 cysteine-rich VLP domain-containing protein [Clostridioides difficile]